VNLRRNNYPYAEVDSTVVERFTNGSKYGYPTKAGSYKGLAYEPIDEYKGDLARTYFYMVTRYEHQVAHWSKEIEWGTDPVSSTSGKSRNDIVDIKPIRRDDACPMLDTTSYPVFFPWAHQMLLRWHRLDPVSDKERLRNQGIFAEQNNRNPFIDHPELVEYIWGDSIGKPWIAAVTTSAHAESKGEVNFTVYPNPNTGEFTIALPDNVEPKAVDVYSLDGILYPCVSLGAQRYRVTAPSGLYFVRVTTRHGASVKKIWLQ
jgi:hypothetical protein